jgi:3-deoxy-manno-octulosonate cytidylyltransferase (CMP-KDO synthetase)
MMTPGILCVIPARLKSTRLARKLLQPIEGKPLLYHTWKAATDCRLFSRVVIAVDDPELEVVARSFGAEAMMTSTEHTCGTERVAEVARKVSASLIVNLQADEPLITESALATLTAAMSDGDSPCWTLASPMTEEEARQTSVVKVVTRADGTALYFSRSLVPYPRNPVTEFLKHLGVYGYTAEGLEAWVRLPASALEQAESLEQLRILEAGFAIRVVRTEGEFVAVDTEADLWRARALIRLRTL